MTQTELWHTAGAVYRQHYKYRNGIIIIIIITNSLFLDHIKSLAISHSRLVGLETIWVSVTSTIQRGDFQRIHTLLVQERFYFIW